MHRTDLDEDPFQQFKLWHDYALKSNEADVDAMFLATATESAKPSIRVVLYKGLNEKGFLIYTNYGSRKAAHLDENPNAALALYWPKCCRQVRVGGRVEKLSSEESEKYFHSRPRDSQIAAWASEQSQEIRSRDVLLERFEALKQEFAQQKEVPYPEFWGGYCVIPDEIEFWQGQKHRLHDRFCYRRKADQWEIVRLAP